MPPIAFYGSEFSGLIFFSPVRFKPDLILVPHTNLSALTACSKLAKEAATHPGKAIILARIGWVGIKTHIEQFVQKIQAGVEDAAKESLRLGQRVGVSWDGRRHYPPPPNSDQVSPNFHFAHFPICHTAPKYPANEPCSFLRNFAFKWLISAISTPVVNQSNEGINIL